jgi:pyridoxamine 5'-phosphate oxidase
VKAREKAQGVDEESGMRPFAAIALYVDAALAILLCLYVFVAPVGAVIRGLRGPTILHCEATQTLRRSTLLLDRPRQFLEDDRLRRTRCQSRRRLIVKEDEMNKEQIIEFINKNPVCFLATSDGQQPRVRGMMTYKADAAGILFNTGRPKDMYKQIAANPRVELCYFSAETNVQVRVTGKAQIVEDMDLKKQIVKERTFLQPIVEKAGFDLLVVFRVIDCEAVVWTFATNMEPKKAIKF